MKKYTDINEVFSLKSGRKLKDPKGKYEGGVFYDNGELIQDDVLQFIDNGEVKIRYKIENGVIDRGWHNVLPGVQEKLKNGETPKKGGHMGHFIFIILHILCVLFGLVGLIVTIPLHIIYTALKSKS